MVAIIYKPAKSASQSGTRNTKYWFLEYKESDTRFNYLLVNWAGNIDMKQQIKLKFNSKEEAVSYAERENIDYRVVVPKTRKILIQSYSDNFK